MSYSARQWKRVCSGITWARGATWESHLGSLKNSLPGPLFPYWVTWKLFKECWMISLVPLNLCISLLLGIAASICRGGDQSSNVNDPIDMFARARLLSLFCHAYLSGKIEFQSEDNFFHVNLLWRNWIFRIYRGRIKIFKFTIGSNFKNQSRSFKYYVLRSVRDLYWNF